MALREREEVVRWYLDALGDDGALRFHGLEGIRKMNDCSQWDGYLAKGVWV